MNRPLPANLKSVYSVMDPESASQMYGGASFTLDGVEFVSGYTPESTAERFYIVKSPELISMYMEFLDAHRPARVFELGIAEGGSVAMLALLGHVERLVAIDNEPNRLPALDEFVARRGMEQSVTAYYAVDQADAATLNGIVDRDFAEGQVDLVIDDASHVYELSVASFEALFPRLATGGWYVIEDWAQALKFVAAAAKAIGGSATSAPMPEPGPPEPLSRLGLELTLATCVSSTVIDRVEVNHEFIAVRRGPGPIDPSSFSLAEISGGPAPGFLAPRRTGA